MVKWYENKVIKTPIGNTKVIKIHHRTPPVYEIECPRGCGRCLWTVDDKNNGGYFKCPYCRKENPLSRDLTVIQKIKQDAKIEYINRKHRSEIIDQKTWTRLRYQILRRDGGKCVLCGRSVADGIKLHVDHIIPLSVCPERRYDPENLQTLCNECNIGKSNTDTIDWRK